MHPYGPGKNFFWPIRNDECWVLNSEVICLISTPTSISGRTYNISDLDLENISSWLQKKINYTLNYFVVILFICFAFRTCLSFFLFFKSLDVRLKRRGSLNNSHCLPHNVNDYISLKLLNNTIKILI